MAGSSDIEWTEATWNPLAGCTMLSAGCTNCYAMRMAARLQAMKIAKYAGTTRKTGNRHVWTGRVNVDPNAVLAPLSWAKPQRIFVNSMSDLFQEAVNIDAIRSIWQTMQRANWHQYQILTKRPARMAKMIEEAELPLLKNAWLGTSVESAAVAHRIKELLSVPAAVRFISFEPLIGSVGEIDLSGIDWAIVGGESGPGARPMKSDWVREIQEACLDAGVAFFFKQWGGVRKKVSGRQLDGRTYDEYPALN